MKALPLILIFALLGVNTPFSAQPEQKKPVTEIQNAAEWDAMFSSEAFENVTYTTRTVIEGDEYSMESVTFHDGCREEYINGGENGFSILEEYRPDDGILLVYSELDGAGSFSYASIAPEGWAAMSNFYLEGQYAGRFDEAEYDSENGCYVLSFEDATASIYAENGRLVKLIDGMTIGSAYYQSESLFFDYGTTVVSPMPEFNAAVDAEAWANAFSAEGLKNTMIDTYGENAAGGYSTYLTVGENGATLSYYGDPTEANPDGFVNEYAYEPTEEGVYTFLEEDYGWLVTSLDPEITWENALLQITGLYGYADAFDGAVYDEENGCYTFTVNQLDTEMHCRAFFIDGQLIYLQAESEDTSFAANFTYYEEGEISLYGPFNAVG